MRQEIEDGKELPEKIGERLMGGTRNDLRKSYVIFKDRLYIIVYFPAKNRGPIRRGPELETLLILIEGQKKWLKRWNSPSCATIF